MKLYAILDNYLIHPRAEDALIAITTDKEKANRLVKEYSDCVIKEYDLDKIPEIIKPSVYFAAINDKTFECHKLTCYLFVKYLIDDNSLYELKKGYKDEDEKEFKDIVYRYCAYVQANDEKEAEDKLMELIVQYKEE